MNEVTGRDPGEKLYEEPISRERLSRKGGTKKHGPGIQWKTDLEWLWMRGGFPSRLLHKEPDDLLRIVPTYDDRVSKRSPGQLVPAYPEK